MPKYRVTWNEILTRSIEVEAEDEQDAYDQALNGDLDAPIIGGTEYDGDSLSIVLNGEPPTAITDGLMVKWDDGTAQVLPRV